jgi:hypothetical protein
MWIRLRAKNAYARRTFYSVLFCFVLFIPLCFIIFCSICCILSCSFLFHSVSLYSLPFFVLICYILFRLISILLSSVISVLLYPLLLFSFSLLIIRQVRHHMVYYEWNKMRNEQKFSWDSWRGESTSEKYFFLNAFSTGQPSGRLILICRKQYSWWVVSGDLCVRKNVVKMCRLKCLRAKEWHSKGSWRSGGKFVCALHAGCLLRGKRGPGTL